MTDSTTSIAYATLFADMLTQIEMSGHITDWDDDSSEQDQEEHEDWVGAKEDEYLNYSQEH